MAITKTVTIKSVRYTEATTQPLVEPKLIWVDTEIFIDDPDDDQLPIVKTTHTRFKAEDDVSGEDPLVQRIHAAVFAA